MHANVAPQAQLVLMREAPDGSGSEAYMCGASMITDRIALTAAHCFFGEDGANMQFDFSQSLSGNLCHLTPPTRCRRLPHMTTNHSRCIRRPLREPRDRLAASVRTDPRPPGN